MRVTIEHTQTKIGLIIRNTVPAVRLSIIFTELEKAVIKENKLGNYTAFTIEPPSFAGNDPLRDVPVKYLLTWGEKGHVFTCDDPIHARATEHVIREGLQNL